MSNVVLYHQQGCGMCRAVEMMLKQKGIEFESKLITPENVNEFKSMGIEATPTLEVDGQRFVKKECLDYINSR